MRTPTQTRRLWELVDLMKYDPDQELFTMRSYTHGCGAPACLFGHAMCLWPELHHDSDASDFFGLNTDEKFYLFAAIEFSGQPRNNDTPSIAASRVIDVIEGGE